MKHIVNQWIERFENDKDIDLFDLISTNCNYLSKWELEKMIREIVYYFVKKRDRQVCEEFIEQLKEYRDEWFEESED